MRYSPFVQSDDVEIAIVAKDTLKSLLQTKKRTKLYSNILEDEFVRVVAPFYTPRKKVNPDIPELPDEFFDRLISIVGLTRNDVVMTGIGVGISNFGSMS